MSSSNAPPTDPTLVLLQRISEDQGRLVDRLQSQGDDQHAIKLVLAEVSARLEPLAVLPAAFADLRLQVARHEMRLDANAPKIEKAASDIAALQRDGAQRSGWEGFGGKMLYLGGGAVLTLAVGMALAFAKPAKAATPDLRVDNAANKKCWAVNAPAKPKWLYL